VFAASAAARAGSGAPATSNGVDETDHIDAALSQLEKMLNDSVAESASPASAPPTSSSAAGPAGDVTDNDAGGRHSVYVECTEIPRLTAQLHYAT